MDPAEQNSEYSWRVANSDADAIAIAPLLLIDMFREVGRGTLNPDKAFMAVYQCVRSGKAAMIFNGDKLVGSIGLVEMDFWYSDDPQLVEQWAYIAPAYRNRGSFRAIFDAVRHIAATHGHDQANIIIFNETRSKPRSLLSHIGEQFSFRPAGAVISVEAAE